MRIRGVTLALAGIALSLSIAALARDDGKAREGLVTRSDFEIVDCLLPGQVRQLGNMTYVTARRPTRTTTADCRVRGGEYVAYDRADVKSALRIWLGAAQSGDPAAQNNVGEIYERGVGATPDYAAAALWYEKAAKQGYSRALLNLGLLYEQGLGVPRDPLKALNLYRQAAGVPQNSVIFEDAARKEEESLRSQLSAALQEKDAQIDALKKQVDELERKVRAESHAASASAGQSRELDALRTLVRQLQTERSQTQERLASLAVTREPAAEKPLPPLPPTAAIRSVMGQNIGRFYALVIANQDYRFLDSLRTPRSDAARIAQVLRDKYGFTVQEIDDANDVQMLRALNDLDKVLRPEDNLLIYYAGHGWRVKSGDTEVGYWLPVNAQRPPDDTYWVPNSQITAHIGWLPAKRILVVADSCYAGLLSSDPSANLFGAGGDVTAAYLKYKLAKRSRLLIASGGDEPVLDAGGQGHSVFARAFLDVLTSNQGVLSTPGLFAEIRDRMKQEEAANAREQAAGTRGASGAAAALNEVPDLKSIRSAGHEMGDFFFVPVAKKG